MQLWHDFMTKITEAVQDIGCSLGHTVEPVGFLIWHQQQPQTAITVDQNQSNYYLCDNVTTECLLFLHVAPQGQQGAQTADGQTIVHQPVNADGTVLQHGKLLIEKILY